MPELLQCPEYECWQALFGEALPAELREDYERHLESCPICQGRLDRAEEYRDSLRNLGRQIGDPTLAAADPTLTQVVARLREGKGADRAAAGEPTDLYFLRPTDRPDILGVLGTYEVREVIGQGGMGVVLEALDPALNRVVAIKVPAAAVAGSAVARQRFAREARAAAAVCHENIVTVHGVYEADGLPYLVMQYVVGESLQERLDRVGPLEVEEVVRIGMQTALGLAAAHAQGLVHRDIKPANLLLSFSRDAESSERSARPPALRSEDSASRLNPFMVKITDFGLARMIDDVALTQNGVVAGTPEYMAPEQARGESVDHRVDLFSLGSVLYACCTGQPPFQGATAVAVLRQVSDQTPSPVRQIAPHVPAWLEALIVRLMAKAPADRFASAAEVADLLARYLAHLQQPRTAPAPELPCSRSPGKKKRFRIAPRLWLAAVALLTIVGLGKSLLALIDAPPAPSDPTEFYQDFRDGKELNPLFKWSGRTGEEEIEHDDKGLRIKLPAVRSRTFPVGVAVTSPLKGDLEITTGCEFVELKPPHTGNGVGFEVYVTLNTPAQDALAITRVIRTDGEQLYVCNRMTGVPPARHHDRKSSSASGRVGRLRVVRKGREVTVWAADGEAVEFRELARYDVPPVETRQIRVAAYPGNSAEAVDVRIRDLRIRSEMGLAEANADPRAETAASPGWLGAATLLGLGVVLALAGGLWLYRRRGRGDSPAAPAVVSFACSECGRTLKAKAELAGKKVKCSGCGKPVVVAEGKSSTLR